MKRMQAEFEHQGPSTPVIYIDAWKYDYYEDPLYALIAAVDVRLQEVEGQDSEDLRKRLFAAAAKVVAPLGKLVGGIAEAAGSGVPVAPVAEGLVDFGKVIYEANAKKRSAHDDLKRKLRSSRDILLGRQRGTRRLASRKVVIMIDELDRCRPDYAIRFLERVKHFFDLDGFLFLVAIDGDNLQGAVQTVYGAHIDGERYLRKFFDLELYLPSPSTQSFNAMLRDSFDLFVGLPAGTSKNWPAMAKELVEQGCNTNVDSDVLRVHNQLEASAFFEAFSEALGLRLRDQAQAYARLYATVAAFGGKNDFFPVAAAFIVCLRYFDYTTYEGWRKSKVPPLIGKHSESGQFYSLVSLKASSAKKALKEYLQLAAYDNDSSLHQYVSARMHSGFDKPSEQFTGATFQRVQNVRSLRNVVAASHIKIFAFSELLSDESSK